MLVGRLFTILILIAYIIGMPINQSFGYVNGPASTSLNPYVLADISCETSNNFTTIIIATNEELDFVHYALENPNRIVIDFMGSVYCELEQNIDIDSGRLKTINISKDLTSIKPDGLDSYFYAVDYIVAELGQPIDVGFARAEITAFDCVIEQPPD